MWDNKGILHLKKQHVFPVSSSLRLLNTSFLNRDISIHQIRRDTQNLLNYPIKPRCIHGAIIILSMNNQECKFSRISLMSYTRIIVVDVASKIVHLRGSQVKA